MSDSQEDQRRDRFAVPNRPGSLAGLIETRRGLWVHRVGDPEEDLNFPPRIVADRAREPEIPGTWSGRSFWQRSILGNIPGVIGEYERDAFHGVDAHLRQLTLPCRGDAWAACSATRKTCKSHLREPSDPFRGFCRSLEGAHPARMRVFGREPVNTMGVGSPPSK